MTRFDVKSLFTSILLEATISISVKSLFHSKSRVTNLLTKSFKSLFELPSLDFVFIFDGKYYKQIDGVAMDFPLGSPFANVFFYHFDCPNDYQPISKRRYID